jgi:hypothetical protein
MTTVDVDVRVQRAKDFFEARHNLAGQRRWYSDKATKYKSWHGRLGFVVLAAGAGTSLIQVVGQSAPASYSRWIAIVTAGLGVLVILAKGADQIWHFGEHWISYRRASEEMKHERRVYVNGAGEYAAIADEEAAFRLFVDQIEEIVATEQRAFWKRASEKPVEEEKAPDPAV